MVKICAPEHRIYIGCYIDHIKPISSLYMLKPVLLTSKDNVPFNKKQIISGSIVKKELEIDTTFDPP